MKRGHGSNSHGSSSGGPWEENEEDAAAEEEWRRRLRRGGKQQQLQPGDSSSSTSPPASPAAPAAPEEEQAAEEGEEETVEPPPLPAAAASGDKGEGGEWLPATDPGTGAPYFYNARTGESSWVAPSTASPRGAGKEKGGEQEAAGDDDDGDGASRPLLPAVVPSPAVPSVPPAVARLQRALDLADGEQEQQGQEQEQETAEGGGGGGGGWVELLDPRWGRLYYCHAGTGRTQWERPPGFQGDTTTPAYEPPPRPFTAPAAVATAAAAAAPAPAAASATTADAIAAWVAEAQQPGERGAGAGAGGGGGQELSVYEEMGYRATLNKRTGQVMIRGPMFERAEDDRDRRQLAHFVDMESLAANRAAEARRRAERQRQRQPLGPEEWRRIREDKKAKKRRRDMEWLLKD